jgi:hypothetical protein
MKSKGSLSATASAERVLYHSCGFLIGALWLMVVLGAPKVARTYAHPTLAVALAVSVTVYLTIVWRKKGWATSTCAWAAGALAGSAAGTLLTYLAGRSAMDGSNLGITLVAWSSELLALHLGGGWWWSLLLVCPLLPYLMEVSPLAAVGVLAWLTMAAFVAGRLSRALRDFGRQTDDALARVVALERATARGIVQTQAAALTLAAAHSRVDQEALRELADVLASSQQFLRPTAADGLLSIHLKQRLHLLDIPDGLLLIDVNHVQADLPPLTIRSVCDAVAMIVASRASSGTRTLDLRARSEGGQWEVSLVDDEWDHPTMGDLNALLSKSTRTGLNKGKVDVRTRNFPGGGCQIRLMRRSSEDGG